MVWHRNRADLSLGRGLNALMRARFFFLLFPFLGLVLALAYRGWLGLLLLGVLFFGALTWLIARLIVSASLKRRDALLAFAVFTLAALLRLALDTGRGYEGDIAVYLALAWKTVHFGIHSAYLPVTDVPPPNNPPLLLYPFWLLGSLYQQFCSPLFPPPWLSDPGLLRFMLRLPSLIADLLAGALIFRALQRISFTFKASLVATSAYLFNPALIFDSAYWGQTAAVHTLFMLLSLIATERRAYGWAGAALTAAVLTKPQALAIAPLIFVLVLRERGAFRFGAAASGAALLITAPFLLTGNIGSVLENYASVAEHHPFLAVCAHNFWWLISGGQGWLPDTIPVGPLSARSAGLFLFACATLLSLIAVWRDRHMMFLAAAYQSLAFFMLNTQIHENHLLPMFAPLVIAVALDRSACWLYGTLTLTALANMALHDPTLLMWLGYASDDVTAGSALALPRWLNAAAQTAFFIAFTLRLIRSLLRGFRPRLPGVDGAN